MKKLFFLKLLKKSNFENIRYHEFFKGCLTTVHLFNSILVKFDKWTQVLASLYQSIDSSRYSVKILKLLRS